MTRIVAGLAALFVLGACAAQPTKPERGASTSGASTSGESSPAPAAADTPAELAAPPAAWAARRAQKAHRRLAQTEAGRLVWRSIEAHGGLERWYANGPLYFRFVYQPVDGRTARDTYQTVDTWSARARHQLAGDSGVEFGWDGDRAWVAPAGADPKTNPRFWALTPYYFVAMPFVLADPGVHLEKTGTAELHGRPHDVVKATFGDGVGESPDDYYIVYLDADTGRFGGLRYIVTYRGFFPDGGHSPEKLMVYEGQQTAGGITFAKRYPTYKWNADTGERGAKVTDVTMSEVAFRPDTPDAFFDVPDKAGVVEGY